MLVLEQSRVEVSVLLNELAYLKYEASKSSSSIDDEVHLKQRTLATPFSLIEKIIKLVSDENEGMPMSWNSILVCTFSHSWIACLSYSS